MSPQPQRAYLAIKYHPDHSNRDLIELISGVLRDAGWQATCVARDIEKWGEVHLSPQELMRKSFAEIEQSQMVVIDLTEKGVGIGIEAGYAYAHHIPILIILPDCAELSNTLSGIANQTLRYSHVNDLPAILKRKLINSAESDIT